MKFTKYNVYTMPNVIMLQVLYNVVYWHSGYQPICTQFTLFTVLYFNYIQVKKVSR